MTEASTISIPEAARAHLIGLIERQWPSEGPDNAAAAITALPVTMPAGVVVQLAERGMFGSTIAARLDLYDGVAALEVLTNNRMSGQGHYRLWADGTVEPLPSQVIGYSYKPDAAPEEIERVRQDYFARNREITRSLAERGFDR